MLEASRSTVYVKHADLADIEIKHHLPLIICEAMNDLIPEHVKGAQLMTGIWSICLRSPETKNYLLEGSI